MMPAVPPTIPTVVPQSAIRDLASPLPPPTPAAAAAAAAAATQPKQPTMPLPVFERASALAPPGSAGEGLHLPRQGWCPPARPVRGAVRRAARERVPAAGARRRGSSRFFRTIFREIILRLKTSNLKAKSTTNQRQIGADFVLNFGIKFGIKFCTEFGAEFGPNSTSNSAPQLALKLALKSVPNSVPKVAFFGL